MIPVLVLNLASVIAAPAAGSLEFTGYAPTSVLQSRTQRGSMLLALSLNCTESPAVNTTVEPGAGSLTFTGHIPLAGMDYVIDVPSGTLTLTGTQPAVNVGYSIAVPAGSLALSGHAPSLNYYYVVSPGAGSLAFTGQTPTSVKTSGCRAYGPLMVFGLNLDPQVGTDYTIIVPSVTQYTFTGYVPVAAKSGDVDLGWDDLVSGAASFTGEGVKNAAVSQPIVYPGTGSLAFTGYAATVVNTKLTVPFAGTLSLLGRLPALNISYAVPQGSLTFTGLAPQAVLSGPVVIVPAGSLTFTGHIPSTPKNIIGSGQLVSGRGFIFKYEDQYGTGVMSALPASMESYINRGVIGEGELISGVATIVNRGWTVASTESDDWTCQDDAVDAWTDESTITDTWTNV